MKKYGKGIAMIAILLVLVGTVNVFADQRGDDGDWRGGGFNDCFDVNGDFNGHGMMGNYGYSMMSRYYDYNGQKDQNRQNRVDSDKIKENSDYQRENGETSYPNCH